MSRTKRQYTKKELVTAEVHRKAGVHKEKDTDPKVCPECRGACGMQAYGFECDWIECSKCKGLGVI